MAEKRINPFIPVKKFLICMDSDGSVMDTMNRKHKKCFGPCLNEIWDIEGMQQEILGRWEQLNLYSGTRGVNRYISLCMLLREIDRGGGKIEDLKEFKQWVESSAELSNAALESEIERRELSGEYHGLTCMKKALSWSKKVNELVEKLGAEDRKSFPGTKKALQAAGKMADIAVVSSANPEALRREWDEQGFLPYVDVLMSQSDGTKTDCIEKLLKKGYKPRCVMMIGDAPGDAQAAFENHVWFYPVLAGREEASWQEFRSAVLPIFIEGRFDKRLQDQLMRDFCRNLNIEEI